jgi:hypothetical protein
LTATQGRNRKAVYRQSRPQTFSGDDRQPVRVILNIGHGLSPSSRDAVVGLSIRARRQPKLGCFPFPKELVPDALDHGPHLVAVNGYGIELSEGREVHLYVFGIARGDLCMERLYDH